MTLVLGDGDEKEKGLPESEHGPPIEGLQDLLEAPKLKEWVSEEVATKEKSSLAGVLEKGGSKCIRRDPCGKPDVHGAHGFP